MAAKKTVIVVGGGLVGALEAVFLSRRGYNVELFELRRDIRKEAAYSGRSINLALSTRGIAALKHVGLDAQVTSNAIPMHSRMIHSPDGKMGPIPYGKKGQAILSVDRRRLNEILLDAAEKNPSVKLHFGHKLTYIDSNTNTATFTREDGSKVTAHADLIIGADGAYSAVRLHMQKTTRFNYKQEYITHGYKELHIPATAAGEYALPTNYLHIWPRHTFMMIALPNPDKSFTCTLFMPFDNFSKVTTDSEILAFFQENFSDAIPLIGKERLLADYKRNPTSNLVLVKCFPYNVDDRVLIVGDAAHAMVPFYGQGMNCGFEDLLVLDEILNETGDDLSRALPEYSRRRNPDAEAILDLALANYVEMRHKVASRAFLMRKKIDNALNWLFPNTFIPLYSMVTFSRIPYAEVVRRSRRQDAIVTAGVVAAAGAVAATVGALLFRRFASR